MVHGLRVFDTTCLAAAQTVSWLRTKQDINRFPARWLDDIEEFRFDVEHVPGRLEPADPLTGRGFPDRDPCTARPDAATDPSPAPAAAAVASPPSAAASPPPATAAAAVAAVRPAATVGWPPGPGPPGHHDTFTPLAGAQVRLVTGTVTVPHNPVQLERHLLSPGFAAIWSRLELPTDPFFGPIFKRASANVGGAVDCCGHALAPATHRPVGGAFIICCCFFTAQGEEDNRRLAYWPG